MSLSGLHSIRFAAETAKRFISKKGLPLETIDHGVLGMTVPQDKAFWGVPWLMSLIGAPQITGRPHMACEVLAQHAALPGQGWATRSNMLTSTFA
ncbi:hypothetical protein [Mesorhizobium sp.]|uniref:hypothetical protein n=1 Tax=Mesorhizobium sp. TaxID=1871066 RepID=UPI0025FF4E67|nr:hypothetical protein [Mesorhizobium sp.]